MQWPSLPDQPSLHHAMEPGNSPGEEVFPRTTVHSLVVGFRVRRCKARLQGRQANAQGLGRCTGNMHAGVGQTRRRLASDCDEKHGVPVKRGFLVIGEATAYGALHWMACCRGHKRVLSFDLQDETLRVANAPDGALQGLSVWNGLLVTCSFRFDENMSTMWAATPSDGGLCWGKVWEFKGLTPFLWIDQFTALRRKHKMLTGDTLHLEDYRVNPIRRQPVQHEELNSNIDGYCIYVESIVSVF